MRGKNKIAIGRMLENRFEFPFLLSEIGGKIPYLLYSVIEITCTVYFGTVLTWIFNYRNMS